MKTRIAMAGAMVSGLMLVAGQATASANVAWCMSDPPVQVVTPGGHYLTINNMVYLPPVSRHVARQITDGASAAPDGHGGTLVTVHVHIPAGVSQAHVVSSDNRYQVTSEAGGEGGVVLTLYLDVPTS